MKIKFNVHNQILKRIDKNTVVSNSSNYLYVKFNFCSLDWKHKEKFALFKDENDKVYNISLGDDDECTCLVPFEVLNGEFFRVCVYGGHFATTNEVSVALIKTGYDGKYFISQDGYSEDVLSRILTLLNTKIDDIKYKNGYLYVYKGHNVIEKINLVYESLIVRLMQKYREEFEEILEDYVKTSNLESILVALNQITPNEGMSSTYELTQGGVSVGEIDIPDTDNEINMLLDLLTTQISSE